MWSCTILCKAHKKEMGICNGKGQPRLPFQFSLWRFDDSSTGKKEKKNLRGCKRSFDYICGLEIFAFHVTALFQVGVIESVWSRPVKKIHAFMFCAVLTWFCVMSAFLHCSAVKHFVLPNNRILRCQIRNLELSEVQIKAASCGDKKKERKKKRGMKFDKVSLALVGKSQCFPPNRPTGQEERVMLREDFIALHRDPSILNRPLMPLQESNVI